MAKKKPMTESKREFLRGYACCLATAVRLEGCWSIHEEELLKSVSMSELRAAEIDEYDAEVIFNPDWHC